MNPADFRGIQLNEIPELETLYRKRIQVHEFILKDGCPPDSERHPTIHPI